MNIQLICSDIDGTLLNKDRQLSKKTIEQVKRLHHIPFILISSRMPKAMVHLQEELENTQLPLIAYNGGLIIDNGKIIDTTEISQEVAESIASFCKETSVHVSLYHNDEWYVPSMDYWAKREGNNTKVTPTVQEISTTLANWKTEGKGAHKIMCMGDEKELDSLVEHIKNNHSEEIIGYRSKPTYLEISHQKISKKTAIETLVQSYFPNVKLDNILAFGDNYNDIEMLKSVKMGVAVANAKDEVLSIADAVTKTNKEDGVALFLEKYL